MRTPDTGRVSLSSLVKLYELIVKKTFEVGGIFRNGEDVATCKVAGKFVQSTCAGYTVLCTCFPSLRYLSGGTLAWESMGHLDTNRPRTNSSGVTALKFGNDFI